MWLSFLITITVWWIVYAAVTLTATSNEALTADKWNNLVTNTARPSWEIAAFDLSNCPDWWTEYTPAYGRFLRWIDKSWTSIDPDWARANWSIQEDMFKSHRHNLLQSQVLRATGGAGAAGNWGNTYNSDYAGGDETRPKNVAVLYCRKS